MSQACLHCSFLSSLSTQSHTFYMCLKKHIFAAAIKRSYFPGIKKIETYQGMTPLLIEWGCFCIMIKRYHNWNSVCEKDMCIAIYFSHIMIYMSQKMSLDHEPLIAEYLKNRNHLFNDMFASERIILDYTWAKLALMDR